jgi:hypothetical protein
MKYKSDDTHLLIRLVSTFGITDLGLEVVVLLLDKVLLTKKLSAITEEIRVE